MSEPKITDSSLKAIRTFFEATRQRTFKTRELQRLVRRNRAAWGLPVSLSCEEILGCTGLKKSKLEFPNRPEVRYCQPNISIYELALALQPDSYLTHHSALFLNGLTDEEPSSVYVNSEQSEKPRSKAALEQGRIDRAFQRPPRITNNVAEYEQRMIHQVSGKHAGRLGVISKSLLGGIEVQTAGIERALIDAVVRPFYCGGVKVVQSAFRRSKGKVSVPLLAEMLDNLDHVYPYHQSVGFFLDQSAIFTDSEVDIFLRKAKKHDFYLEHKMDSPDYSDRWRVYYPKGMNIRS